MNARMCRYMFLDAATQRIDSNFVTAGKSAKMGCAEVQLGSKLAAHPHPHQMKLGLPQSTNQPLHDF